MAVVEFNIRHVRFSVRIWMMLLVVIIVLIMLRAGFWQLSRAQQKIEIQQSYHQAGVLPAISPELALIEPAPLLFRTLKLHGKYQSDRQFLLDNKVYTSDSGMKRLGYHVLTPFETSDGVSLLVDRGWVAAEQDRSRLPDVRVDNVSQSIQGRLYMPGKGFRLGTIDADQHWPRVIQYVDYQKLQERLQQPLYNAVLVLAAGQPGGLIYDWVPVVDKPHKHYGYAVQWFAMALAMVVMFLVFSIKRHSTLSGGNNE